MNWLEKHCKIFNYATALMIKTISGADIMAGVPTLRLLISLSIHLSVDDDLCQANHFKQNKQLLMAFICFLHWTFRQKLFLSSLNATFWGKTLSRFHGRHTKHSTALNEDIPQVLVYKPNFDYLKHTLMWMVNILINPETNSSHWNCCPLQGGQITFEAWDSTRAESNTKFHGMYYKLYSLYA